MLRAKGEPNPTTRLGRLLQVSAGSAIQWKFELILQVQVHCLHVSHSGWSVGLFLCLRASMLSVLQTQPDN